MVPFSTFIFRPRWAARIHTPAVASSICHVSVVVAALLLKLVSVHLPVLKRAFSHDSQGCSTICAGQRPWPCSVIDCAVRNRNREGSSYVEPYVTTLGVSPSQRGWTTALINLSRIAS